MHLSRSSSNVPRLPTLWKCYKIVTFCSLSARCRIPCACHARPHLNLQKWSKHFVLLTFWLGMCFAPQRRVLFRHLNFQKCSDLGVSGTFWLRMCIAPQRRALFRYRNFQKCSEREVLCTFWLGMCFAPQRRVLFRHLNFQKCSDLGVSGTFWLRMCIAPQRLALFQHRSFQKWSEAEVLCAFWLGNVLRAPTACKFSSLIWRDGSAPAALASLLFDPPEPQIIGKTHWFAILLPFRAPASSFFSLFLFSDARLHLLSSHSFSCLFFSSPLWLFPPLLFHLSILSEVWPLNFLRSLN